MVYRWDALLEGGGGAADGGGKPYFFRAIASSFASPYLAASASTSASLLGLCSS